MEYGKVIDKLNEALKHEWTGVAQYAQSAFLVTGLWREVYSAKFLDNAEESFGHAKLVGEKIVALGGVPTCEREPIKQTHDLKEMLEHALAFEMAAVRVYTEALAVAEGDRALVIFLEDMLKQEQEGVDEFVKIVRDLPQIAKEQERLHKAG